MSSRWQEGYIRRCEDCINTCNHFSSGIPNEDSYKRSMTLGAVRYGLRTVSPPPPGAGPRYCSKCCWPGAPYHSAATSRTSMLPTCVSTSINSPDIISYTNKREDAAVPTSDEAPNSVRDSVPYPSGCLLKKHYAASVKSQFYAHFTDYGDVDGTEEDIVTLDRLPRFRFGGNRAEKRASDKFRELTERLKRSATPVPPPRRHTRATPLPISPDISTNRNTPLPMRSASFSQVDYCTDDNKYIRRNQESVDSYTTTNTLPRPKNFLRVKYEDASPDNKPSLISEPLNENPSPTETYKEIPKVQVTSESPEKSLVRLQDNSDSNQDKRRDKLKRRKGIYLSQWPTEYYSNDIEDSTTKYETENLECDCEKTAKVIHEPLLDLSKNYGGNIKDKDSNIVGSSPQEEPLSPEDNNIVPEWPKPSISGNITNTGSIGNSKDSLKVIPKINNVFRSDSLSEGETDCNERRSDQISLISSDISDGESKLSVNNDSSSPNIPRRYSKKPLRGPYGQMLEAEMKKPESRKNIVNELKFLEDFPSATYKKSTKHTCAPTSCNSSIDETYGKETGLSLPRQHTVTKRKVSADNLVMDSIEQRLIPNHHRTTSSPSKLEGLNVENSSDFLEQLLRGSSEQLATKETSQQQLHTDTRNHILVELYDNEKIYVESLESIITNYWDPMKRTESTFIDANVVDEIFCEVPALLKHHTSFFQNLKLRLEHWDAQQIIGDIFLEMLSIPEVMENYINYVNSWKRSREIIKLAQTSKPQFAKFLESASKNISGKLTLDSLLIKPIQKFPKYELLLQRLIKNTSRDHPDYDLLVKAEKQIHELLVKLNCTGKDALDLEQLREIESAIEGVMELVSSDRQYIRHDIIMMSQSGGQRKERALFLFSDLLLITGIKRRSGSVPKKCHTTNSIIMNNLDGYKYKLILKISLDDVDIVRSKDDNLRQLQLELENLNKDIAILNKMNEMSNSLNCSHSLLDDMLKDMLGNLSKNLHLQQNTDIQMSVLDLTLVTQCGVELVNIVFPKAEIRFSWEEALNECKTKLGDKGLFPELLITVPVRKTRAGLQFTCAASTAVENSRDVWVCNSDGHVGQICVLTFEDNLEVNITSCNGVCNTRIVCILAVPGPDPPSTKYSLGRNTDKSTEETVEDDFESSYSDDDDDEDNRKDFEFTEEMNDIDRYSTMWLGTEEGTVFIYNANSKVRMRKNRIKVQLTSGVLSIVYLFDRVFISEASGLISVYERDGSGWCSHSSRQIVLGNYNSPITKMLVCRSKLLCSCGNIIYVMNPRNYEIEQSFVVPSNELSKPISSIPCIFISGNLLWMSLPNCAIIRCYNAITFDLLTEINVAPAVQKMLICYDNIIRQHKSACLRVTALVQCKDILWIGTSAGILLTIKVPHVNSTTTKLANVPQINGIAHGHTGQVRVLTTVEIKGALSKKSSKTKLNMETKHNLVISGGDGFEDFKIASTSDGAGREDSTNYLLFWTM